MSNTVGENKEHMRRMLREAFADVPRPGWLQTSASSEQIPHEQCLEFRSSLSILMPQDLQYVLPRVLEDLLDTHTGDDIETQDAEFVMINLNGSDERKIGFEYRFEHFTREQAQAVCEWLRLARSWRDFNIYIDQANGAFEYWCRRASNSKDGRNTV